VCSVLFCLIPSVIAAAGMSCMRGPALSGAAGSPAAASNKAAEQCRRDTARLKIKRRGCREGASLDYRKLTAPGRAGVTQLPSAATAAARVVPFGVTGDLPRCNPRSLA